MGGIISRDDISLEEITEWKNKGCTELFLRERNLKRFPTTILTIAPIMELDLSLNSLREIPDSLTSLSNLSILVLDSNEIHEFPLVICNLRTLHTLSLNGNRLTCLSESITQLTNLKRLYLNNNAFEKFPLQLQSLCVLEELFMDTKYMNPEELQNAFENGFQQLTTLSIRDIELEEHTFPSSISKLPKLNTLICSASSFPKTFIHLESLEIYLTVSLFSIDCPIQCIVKISDDYMTVFDNLIPSNPNEELCHLFRLSIAPFFADITNIQYSNSLLLHLNDKTFEFHNNKDFFLTNKGKNFTLPSKNEQYTILSRHYGRDAAICLDYLGNIWIISNNILKTMLSLKTKVCSSAYFRSSYTVGHILYISSDGKIVQDGQKELKSEIRFSSIQKTRKEIFATDENGKAYIVNEELDCYQVLNIPKNIILLASTGSTCYFLDEEGALWTKNLMVEDSTPILYENVESIPSISKIFSYGNNIILLDIHGNLWGRGTAIRGRNRYDFHEFCIGIYVNYVFALNGNLSPFVIVDIEDNIWASGTSEKLFKCSYTRNNLTKLNLTLSDILPKKRKQKSARK